MEASQAPEVAAYSLSLSSHSSRREFRISSSRPLEDSLVDNLSRPLYSELIQEPRPSKNRLASSAHQLSPLSSLPQEVSLAPHRKHQLVVNRLPSSRSHRNRLRLHSQPADFSERRIRTQVPLEEEVSSQRSRPSRPQSVAA